MGIIFDIIILVILVLSVYAGYRRGLVKVAVSIIAFVISLLATVALYSPVTSFIINNTQIDANVVGIGSIGVMILLFFVIRFLLTLLSSVASIIANLPIIRQLDEIGGIAYGLLKGLIIVYAVLAIVFFVVSINANDTVSTAIETSHITRFFYNNNIILNILF